MDILVHVAGVLTRNKFLVIPAFLILGMVGPGAGRRKFAWRLLVGTLGVVCFFAGPYLVARLLYTVGQTATAQVIDTYATSISANDRNVVGYHVMIRDGGTILMTRFEDDEFNMYPVPDAFSYPQPGMDFTVRFLRGYPRDFVIVTDDDSPWAHRQRCDALSLRVVEARGKFNFAGGAVAFRAPYVAAIDAYLGQGCAAEAQSAAAFRDDQRRALAGVVDSVEPPR